MPRIRLTLRFEKLRWLLRQSYRLISPGLHIAIFLFMIQPQPPGALRKPKVDEQIGIPRRRDVIAWIPLKALKQPIALSSARTGEALALEKSPETTIIIPKAAKKADTKSVVLPEPPKLKPQAAPAQTPNMVAIEGGLKNAPPPPAAPPPPPAPIRKVFQPPPDAPAPTTQPKITLDQPPPSMAAGRGTGVAGGVAGLQPQTLPGAPPPGPGNSPVTAASVNLNGKGGGNAPDRDAPNIVAAGPKIGKPTAGAGTGSNPLVDIKRTPLPEEKPPAPKLVEETSYPPKSVLTQRGTFQARPVPKDSPALTNEAKNVFGRRPVYLMFLDRPPDWNWRMFYANKRADAGLDKPVYPPSTMKVVNPFGKGSELPIDKGGLIILRATVDYQGFVSDVEILRELHPGLDAAAKGALSKWTFLPAKEGEMNLTIDVVVEMRVPAKTGGTVAGR